MRRWRGTSRAARPAGGTRMFGVLEGGHARGDDRGLDAIIAAAHPDGADDGFEQVGFDGVDGVELLFVLGGELIEFGGIFAGDDHGLCGDAELEGVAAGDGLALDGARPGGKLCVGAVGMREWREEASRPACCSRDGASACSRP